MNYRRYLSCLTLYVLVFILLNNIQAQVTTPTNPKVEADSSDVVQLPAFEIKSETDTGFVGKSSLGSTRIAVDLNELSQSVKVLNNAMLEAINPMNVPDMLNYVGGAQNGQLFISPGRINIRGFTGDADYVDGFAPPANSNPESSIFDRFEIIKGPSTIFLAADGTPGGIVNKITKSPTSIPSTSITAQLGMYDANSIGIDSNGALTKDNKLLYRIIVNKHYDSSYYDWWYTHRLDIMPALSYQFSEQTKLVVKALFHKAYTGDFQGVPIDPRTLQPFDLPANASDAGPAPQHRRIDTQKRLWFNYTTRFSNFIAFHVSAMTANATHDRKVATPVSWNDSKNTSAIAGYNGTQAFPRSSSADYDNQNYRDIQSDLNFNFKNSLIDNNLLVGGEMRSSPYRRTTYLSSDTAWNPYNPIPDVFTVDYNTTTASVASHDTSKRLFALETLKFLNNHLILSLGATRSINSADQMDQLKGLYTTAPYTLMKNLKQWGVVYKINSEISVFTGYNENFATNGSGLVNGVTSVLPPKQGKQSEVGIKAEFLKKKLSVNTAYFDTKQSNNTVATFPTSLTNPKTLIPGVISRGIDGDLSYQVNSHLFLLGTFSFYKAKSVLGPAAAIVTQPYYGRILTTSIPVDNTAEKAGSIFVNYKFIDIKGLSLGIGSNYQSKRAITDSANQLMFGYAPGRTLVQANINYKFNNHIKYTLNIDNLLNQKYIYSIRSENVIIKGAPIGAKASVTYTF
jgi:iron complex outermembrane receptor protein